MANTSRRWAVLLAFLMGLGACTPAQPEAHGPIAEVQPEHTPTSRPATQDGQSSLIPPRFETFTVSDGLVSNEANVFLQDRQGFLWIGTFGGLSRFDGATFTNFLHDPTDAASLAQNKVNSLFEDRAGSIWVGTNGGLDRFDPETETFTHYRHDPADPASLSHDVVRTVVEGTAGAIWAGTRGGGLNRLDPSTGVLTRIRRPLSDPQLMEDQVHALLANADGTLWVGGSNGLALYDPSTEAFSVVRRVENTPTAPPLPVVYSLCRDHQGAIWAGTRTDGLFRYEPTTGAVVHYPDDPDAPGAIGDPWVLSMTEDDTGTLWIGTNGAGLHRYDRAADAFIRFRYDPSNPHSLRDDNVLTLLQSRDGVLWVGTYGGLARRYPLSRHVAREGVRPDDERSLRSNAVTAFAEDPTGTLWIGTDGEGLTRRETSPSAGFTRVSYDPARPLSRAATDVLSLTVDDDGALWVGAIGGLYRRNPDTGEFSRFIDADVDARNRMMVIYDLEAAGGRVLAGAGLGGVMDIDPTENRSVRTRIVDSPEVVTAVLLDRMGNIWAGTYNVGLWRMVERDGRPPGLQRMPQALSSQQVNTLYEDRTGAIWIGTGDGLDCLTIDGADTTLTRFHRTDGLPDTAIRGILEDRQSRLWIATSTGLSWRDPQTGAFVSYDARDGLEAGGPLYQSPRTGRIYVGGNFGYAAFDPEALTVEPPPPAPVLTGLRMLGDAVQIGADGSPLRRALSMTDELRLRYDDRVVTFAFAALDFRAPSKHRYAVRLDGFDETWREVGGQRQATFTNLSPGRYTFRVRAAGRDGVWGPETALSVTVVPPWWRTWWAYLAYALAAVGLVAAVYRGRQRRLRLRHQMEIERLEAEKLRELDHARSRFFANVSHEFRTPLTLTLGPLDDLKAGLYGELPAPMAAQVDLARRNAGRVLDLINQILDVARLESGRTPLRARPLDLGAFVESVAQPFRALAERKAMTFEIRLPAPPVEVFADPPQLEKVVVNLLSNALKFTPEGGTVHVTVAAEDSAAHMTVRDSGPGIPASDLPHVFDRFYQVNEPVQTQLGTGIGLALAKEIMDLHGGLLTVDSEEGFGSTFTLTLPLGRDHLAPDQIVGDEPWSPDDPLPALPAEPDGEDLGSEERAIPEDADVTTVLVVEDHPEVRAYVRRHLEAPPEGHPAYRVLEAADGEAGLALAKAHLPDLVLSDVMMPKLDGLGLCRALKADLETDFIPVILLTAKAAPEDKLDGLGEHADDYLTKPFDPVELRARIANLIAGRMRLRERFRQEGMALVLGEDPPAPMRLPAPKTVTSADDAFLERVREAVEAHLSDDSFSVQRLAEAVGVSRGHLHRQLKAIVGQTPTDLIRTVRLERATHLLAGRAGTVSEIAYAVGFKSISHFSDSFVQAYGCRPSAYDARAETAEDETS
ncbi:MAG: response regulator [Bacteroidetes bacterium]|jgi:signal transduction histidine kinase/ligand-binding sensor domain-containing protein/DNA-binding response OmpR family regulator|nr:response regulator [Bacteroidota bacterium]